ncbi:MAG: hypothetical protein SFX18_18055 [Pirellulales bacterium]|nr:hypothetical protein [Pirellulales bacterium]
MQFTCSPEWCHEWCWMILGLLLVLITVSPWASGFATVTRSGEGDPALYAAEIARMQAGENFYDAAAAELVSRGYPTKSVFNWRTPFPMAVIALVGQTGGRLLLVCLGVLLLSFAGQALYQRGGLLAAGTGLGLLIGCVLPVMLETAYLLPEVWSGILVGLSLAAYGCQRPVTAVAAGGMALFFRELAAPYVLVCLFFAAKERRRGELAAWVTILILYVLFYAAHLQMVLPRITPHATAHSQGWLAFGGAAFVISLVQMNVWLLVQPQWLSAVVLTVAARGWSLARESWELRVAATGVIYLLAFGCIGMPINQYWGAQWSSVVALGCGMCVGKLTTPGVRESVTKPFPGQAVA